VPDIDNPDRAPKLIDDLEEAVWLDDKLTDREMLVLAGI
jgi:hypothetical protein